MHTLRLTAMMLAASICGPATRLCADADAAPVPEIGEAFDFATNHYLGYSCLVVDPADVEALPPKFGTVSFASDLGYQDQLDGFGFGFTLDVATTSVAVYGHAAYAADNGAAAYSSTATVRLLATGGERRLKPGAHPRLSAEVQAKINADPGNAPAILTASCGSHYVLAKHYQAGLVATLRIEFKNTEAKDAFEAAAHVKVQSAGVDVYASALLDEQATEDALKIHVDAVQFGGDPVRLGQALSASLASCQLGSKSACRDSMSAIVTYAGTFGDQFKTNDGTFDPSRYEVTNLEYGRLTDLVPTAPPPALSFSDMELITSLRRELRDRYIGELTDRRRAEEMLASGAVEDDQKAKIEHIRAVLEARLELIQAQERGCYKPVLTVRDCQTSVDGAVAALQSRPELQFNRADFVILPRDLRQYCERLKGWYKLMTMAAGAGGEAASTYLEAAEVFFPLNPRHTLLALLNYPGVADRRIVETAQEHTADTDLPDGLDCHVLDERVAALRQVSLRDMGLVNLEPLATLRGAISIDLSGRNPINDLTPLGKIDNLLELIRENGPMPPEVLRGLAALPSLRILSLAGSLPRQISENDALGYLSPLKNLTHLDLRRNWRLSSLAQLRGLPSLYEVDTRDTALANDQVLDLGRKADEATPSPLKTELPSLKRLVVGAAAVTFPADVCGKLIPVADAPRRKPMTVCEKEKAYEDVLASP